MAAPVAGPNRDAGDAPPPPANVKPGDAPPPLSLFDLQEMGVPDLNKIADKLDLVDL